MAFFGINGYKKEAEILCFGNPLHVVCYVKIKFIIMRFV